MKIRITIAALLSVLSSGVIQTTFEFRSPISVARGVMHWPLMPSYNAWWYDMMPNDKKESKWNIHTWNATFGRCADKAYFNVEKNKNTRKTTSLSTLFFGKEMFRGEEIFAGGTFAGREPAGAISDDLALVNRVNPFLCFARITPRFDYNEWGAYVGLHVDRRFGDEEKWHAGGRVSLPFKVIEIEQNNTAKLEETLDDVVRFRQVNQSADGQGNNLEFAARFDFLNTLISSVGGDPIPFIRYNDDDTIDATGRRITGTSSAESNAIPAAYVIKRDDGEFPLPVFRKTPTQVNGELGADGSGADGSTLFFRTDVAYKDSLANNREAQGKLFLVPRATDGSTDIITDANGISQDLFSTMADNFLFLETASEFFRVRGIDLAMHERISAVGDLETEAYVGYGRRDHWFVDCILGVRFPTGKKNKDPKRLFFQSTGHNRHFEIKLALDGGWMPREWFAFRIDASFHHAFRRTEKRAALFKGATVRNIGPTVDARVSWNYFIVHADLNFFHPHNPDLGCMIGYELFAKRKDNVDFKDCTTVTDLLGREDQELDSDAYEVRTNSMAHKIRGELFHRWNYFEIFAGASHIIGGRNVMKETEGHFGFAVYF